MFGVGKLVVGKTILHKGIPGSQAIGGKAFTHFTNLPQLGAGDHSAGLIYDAHHAVDRILHLVDHVLEYPVCHTLASPYLCAE